MTKRRRLNPPKETITIRLDPRVLAYFRELSERLDVPYQRLINHGLGHLADNRWTVPDLERDAADKTSGEGSAA